MNRHVCLVRRHSYIVLRYLCYVGRHVSFQCDDTPASATKLMLHGHARLCSVQRNSYIVLRHLCCKTLENSNFLKKNKMVISVKIWNFSISRMMKRTSPLELSREI